VKLFLVFTDKKQTEGYFSTDSGDADYAATGFADGPYSTAAAGMREALDLGDDDELVTKTIEYTP
jgi:hypothetical protein